MGKVKIEMLMHCSDCGKLIHNNGKWILCYECGGLAFCGKHRNKHLVFHGYQQIRSK